MTPNWADLDSKGFVVVPRFLPADTVDALLADFDGGRPPDQYPFGFKLVGRRAVDAAWAIIEPALPDIRDGSSIAVDTLNFLTVSHYITTRLAERSSRLHQDFDLDYRLTADHHNYLNFWLPLRKPDPARSNVTLVPFDVLEAADGAACERLRGAGGYRFVPDGGRTRVFGNYGRVLDEDEDEDEEGGDEPAPEMILDLDLDSIAVTPALSAGDLLLMRGDVVHRTQDSDTDRVAASIRVTSSAKQITRARAAIDEPPPAAGSPALRMHRLLCGCFDALGRDPITLGELVQFARGGTAKREGRERSE